MIDTQQDLMLPQKIVSVVRRVLLAWFRVNQRQLPWRQEYLPYHVWISEIMGQQTQMDRVVVYFSRWIEQFPDIATVAAASEQSILKAWEGLGYYSRARNIQKTAVLLTEQYGDQIPADYRQLLALPGIGPYTAAAILSIAFNQDVPVLDANVERLFVRLLDIDQPVKAAATQSVLRTTAAGLLPSGKARLFNQALMEFGALICTPRNPACCQCPLAGCCQSRQQDTVHNRPIRTKNNKTIDIVMACAIIFHQGRYYIQQRKADDVWGSLWEFPGGRLKQGENPEQAALREVEEETELNVKNLTPYAVVVHHYTKYRVTLHSFNCVLADMNSSPVLHAASQYQWVKVNKLPDFPFPAGHRQLVAKLCANCSMNKS
jgi:A/G-specific adenine glycosylase